MENNIHNHSAPPFLMSPGDKLFPPPGSFNFSMAALAADPQALASESETNLIPNLKFMT
jgi:broad-complex core protein